MSNARWQRDAEWGEMRPHLTRQSRADLERLLDGQPVSRDALAELISAARASGALAEMAGLPAALAAFRHATPPAAVNHPRRTSMLKNVAAKIVAAKLLTIGGVALAATGGIAAAASTGHLPSPLPHSSHAAQAAVAAVASSHDESTATSSATDSASASATASETATASESSDPTSAHPSATPSPSLIGLCQSWLSRPHLHGKADTNPAFTVLVTAAGGTDAVEAYCTDLLASGHGRPVTSPTTSEAPSPTASDSAGEPSTIPSHSHPAGKPTALPTPSHPAGR